MTENYIVSLVAWIILYASFWLTKHNPVSTAFRRRECHTGFLAKWLEKTIFPFRWYGSRPTYEYAIGLLLLCCILFTVSLHISVAHFDLPQIYFDTVYEHCRFTFISGICAVCGYYCLIVDVSRIEKVLYIIAALFLLGICISIVSVSVLLLSADWHCLLEEISLIMSQRGFMMQATLILRPRIFRIC